MQRQFVLEVRPFEADYSVQQTLRLICDLLMTGGAESHASKSSVPYMVDGQRWTSYDNEKSLQEKVQWVMGHGFGGVMIWAIDLDDFNGYCGKKYPLMNAVNNAFGSIIG